MKKRLSQFFLVAVAVVLMGQSCALGGGGSVGAGPAGIFVSTDKGENWQQLSMLPTNQGVRNLTDVSVYRLVDDPQDAGALYWLSRTKGMFMSYDEGKTWLRPASPLTNGFIYGAAVHPENKCTVYATNGFLLFKTTDCSRSWQEVYRESRGDERINSVTIDPFFPDTVLVATTGGDIVRSTDRGQNWNTTHRTGLQLVDIHVDPNQDGVMYSVTRKNGLFRSKDGGANWESLEESMKDYSGALEYRRFYVHPRKPGTLYWISTYGILMSTNSGDTWEAMDLITPPGSAQIFGFAVNPQNSDEVYYTATINNRSTFYKSEDSGKTWKTKRLPSSQLPTVLRVHPEKESVLYLGYTIPPSQ